jgi:hypothetical protein
VLREVRSEQVQAEHERNRREKQRDDHMVELRGIQRISQVSDSIVGTTMPYQKLCWIISMYMYALSPVLKKKKLLVLLAP